MNIPLLDLKAQYQSMRSEILAAIEATCDEQGFILGPRVVALDQAVATYVSSTHAGGVASGSDALLLALMALGVKAGDEVITVPFTFFATAGAISRLGAKPVFIDIRPDDFNMDPALLERAITARTKAIIPVHLFGQCADMGAIHDIARRHKIGVIEDACQAIGAAQNGKRAGVRGSIFGSRKLRIRKLPCWISSKPWSTTSCARMNTGTWPLTRMPRACAWATMSRTIARGNEL